MINGKSTLKAYEKEYNAWVEELGIYNKWKPDPNFFNTQERRWDDRAEDFVKRPIPTTEDNDFLKKLCEVAELGPETTVLDIGCGGGHLSIALAPYVKSVLGIDISVRMINYAKKLAAEHKAENVTFKHKNWNDMASDDPLIKNGFDIVFAHMTPAIGEADDFLRMIDLCKGHLFMTKPVRRHNPVAEGMWNHVGEDAPVMSSDKDIASAFIIGWQKGYSPELIYGNRTWNGEMTVDEVVEKYRDEFSYRELEFNEEKVRDYFLSVAEGGMVDDTTHTEIATIFWSV